MAENFTTATVESATLAVNSSAVLIEDVILATAPLYRHKGKAEDKRCEGTLPPSHSLYKTQQYDRPLHRASML